MVNYPRASISVVLLTIPFLALSLLLLLAGCQGNAPDPSPNPTTVAATRIPEGTSVSQRPVIDDTAPTPTNTRVPNATRTVPKMATYGGMVRPDDVYWYRKDDSNPLGYLLGQQLHASLLNPLTYAPWIAAHWTLTGNRATFTLAPDARWSDGAPIRAADVADILQQGIDRGDLNGVGDIDTDGNEITVTLTGDVCPTLTRVAGFPLVDSIDEFPPFRTSGGVTVEQTSDNEWMIQSEDSGTGFVYRVYDNEVNLREDWASGELSGVIGASRLKLGHLDNGTRDTQTRSNRVAGLIFRLQDATVQSTSLREALSTALDPAVIFYDAYGDKLRDPSFALLPSGSWAMPERALQDEEPNSAEAFRIAGYGTLNSDGLRINANNETLRITLMAPLSPDEQWEAVAKGIAAQWREAGVDITIQYVENYALEERLHDGRWQIALLPYQLADDPDQRALWTPPVPTDLIGQDLNVTGYNNPTVTQSLYEAALLPGCDLTARGILYKEAWETILTDIPVLPLFSLPLDIVVQ